MVAMIPEIYEATIFAQIRNWYNFVELTLLYVLAIAIDQNERKELFFILFVTFSYFLLLTNYRKKSIMSKEIRRVLSALKL